VKYFIAKIFNNYFATLRQSFRISIIFVIIKTCSTMAIWLKIYLIGFIVAMFLSVNVMKEKDGRISLSDLGISLLMSLLSWSMVLGLWIAGNIRENN